MCIRDRLLFITFLPILRIYSESFFWKTIPWELVSKSQNLIFILSIPGSLSLDRAHVDVTPPVTQPVLEESADFVSGPDVDRNDAESDTPPPPHAPVSAEEKGSLFTCLCNIYKHTFFCFKGMESFHVCTNHHFFSGSLEQIPHSAPVDDNEDETGSPQRADTVANVTEEGDYL